MTNCPSCGTPNAPHARFCQVCGTPIPASAPGEPPSEGPEEPFRDTAGSTRFASADVSASAYAGFWIRALAFLIDGCIVFAGTLVLGFGSFGAGFFLSVVAPWLYEAFMVSSSNQATLGKMALGLRVTDEEGQRLTFTHATGRHFAKYLSALPLFAGYLIAAFTERKQALHDLILKTYVLRNYG